MIPLPALFAECKLADKDKHFEKLFDGCLTEKYFCLFFQGIHAIHVLGCKSSSSPDSLEMKMFI